MAETQSNIVTGVSTEFVGSYLHRPEDPEGSLFHLSYGGVGKQEGIARDKTALKFAGRKYAVMDIGEGEEHRLDLTTTILYGPEWDLRLERLREMARSPATWLYRDKRGRKMYVVATSFTITDIPYAYEVAMTIEHVDFTEEV